MQIINSKKYLESNFGSLAIVFSIALIFSRQFHFQFLKEFPEHIHAWSQSDWYAIALGFTNNGFDFFHPQSFNLYPNCSSPKVWPSTLEGITAVDFPIHHYVMAILMKLAGNYSPLFPRLYVLFYAYLGFYFLFLLGKKFLSNNWLSIIMPVFVLSSPVFIYYQISFLPSIPSFSNTIIAYYFFFQFLERKNFKYLITAILFFLLASMPRTPFFIFFFASFCQVFYLIIMSKQIKKQALIYFGIGFLIFFAYYFYNQYLAETYGSIYLRTLLHANSLDEVISIIKIAFESWGLHYFTTFHYYFLGLMLALTMFFIVFKIKKNASVLRSQLGFHLIIVWLGAIIYFVLMLEQFKVHDYYFIDSFFIPVVLSLLFLISFVPKNAVLNYTFLFLTLILANNSFGENKDRQHQRRSTGIWDTVKYDNRAYKNSDKFLDKMGISKSAKILALKTFTTNSVLILMNRKGFTQLFDERIDIEFALKQDFDFVVINDMYLINPVLKLMPELPSLLNRIGGNGKISVYKRSTEAQSNEAFLGLNDSALSSINYDFSNEFEGEKSKSLNQEFNTLKIIKDDKISNRDIHKVIVNIGFICSDTIGSFLFLKAKNQNEEFINMFNLSKIKNQSDTVIQSFIFPLGMEFTQNDSLDLYIWNPNKAKQMVNSLSVELIYEK